jgi:diguanylate cyclase (GGDEF)-like protein
MASPEEPTVAALSRFLASRLDVTSVGIFLVNGPRARLWSGTEAFLLAWSHRDRVREGSAATRRDADEAPAEHYPLPAAVTALLCAETASRLDPAEIGLDAKYAVIKPVLVADVPRAFLLLLSGRHRWLGQGADAAMQDAADIVSGLLGQPRSGSAMAADTRGSNPAEVDVVTVSHSAALRMIRDLPRIAGEAGGRTLLMLDIDRFRSINEALGSATGDVILARLGGRLEQALGPEDCLARLGGDRFLILSRKSGAPIGDLASSLLASVTAPLPVGGEPVFIQATIGQVEEPSGEDMPAATLFMQADKALKRGKAEGGNRVSIHDPTHDAALRALSRLEVELGSAIRADQLHLVYQPYISLLDGSVAGVEALLRWQHPGRGELTPGSFMTLAEESGRILPIGSWVLREALCRAVDWPDSVRLSVNISALQFQQPDFTAQVDSALALSGFPADRLELEITETVLMRDDPETHGQLRTLIARGIRIALDDFGTGYSALSYLARLPHHRIKLDKSFVDDLDNPTTSKVIQAIVSSARAQGITVTAEGIETEARLKLVREMGFTHAQGFLVGTPMSDPSKLLNRPFRHAIA